MKTTHLPFSHRLFAFYKPDDPPNGGGDPPAADPPNGGADDDNKKHYTQAELDAMFSVRAQRAKSQALKDLLAELGVESVDGLKTVLKTVKEHEDAASTDLEKARKLAETEKARADRLEAEKKTAERKALETALRSALTTEAIKQGVDEAEVGSVWREFRDSQALRDKVEADDDGAEFTGLDNVVKDIIKSHPRWLKDGSQPAARRQLNTNATNRGGAQEPTMDELVRRKRANSQFTGF